MRGVFAWLLIGAALVLANCGGPGPGPSGSAASASASDLPAPTAASGNEACALVRVADIQELMGETPDPQPRNAGSFAVIVNATYSECVWTTDGSGQLLVRVVRAADASVLAAGLDAVWKPFVDFDPVTGVGDEARVHVEGDQAAHVVAVRGDVAVYAAYESNDGAESKRDAVIVLVSDTLASTAS